MDVVRLSDLLIQGAISVTTGFPCGAHNDSGDGEPHIRPFNVGTKGDVSLDQIKYIPFEQSEGKPRIRRGDILFNNTNTKELVGKCATWTGNDYVFSNHMTRIRVLQPSYDARYLSFAILHHWMTGKSAALARSHVAQASIMGARFGEIEVPGHPVEDQVAIADALTHLRKASRIEGELLQATSSLKRAVMQVIFACGLRGEGQKETEIGIVPDNWDVVALGDICALSTGTTPATKQADYYVGTTPFIKTAEIVNNRLSKASAFVSDEAVARYNLKIYPAGTILMAMYGQGKTRGQVSLLEIPATTSQNAAAIQLGEQLRPRFLWHFLLSRYEYLRGIGSLGHLSHLNLGYLRELLIPVPPDEHEQDEIANILDAIDRKINLHRHKRAVLDELFKALLHKLMTGEIRVADLDLSALVPKEAPEVAA